MLKLLRELFNLYRPASELPQAKGNGMYSYDVILHDGKEKHLGYYSHIGEIYHAYEHVLLLPVIKWKYAKAPRNG